MKYLKQNYLGIIALGLLALFAAGPAARGADAVSIVIAPDGGELTAGGTLALHAIGVGAAGIPVVPQPPIAWVSSNPSVAAVDSSGNVAGISAGSAIITASSGAMSQNAAIAVIATPFSLSASGGAPAADPVHGFPLWFEDVAAGRTKLQPCLGLATGGTGVLDFNCPIPDPAADPSFNANAPVVFPSNFPKHPVYWAADTVPAEAGAAGAAAKFHYALEGAFSTADGSPAPGAQTAELVLSLGGLSGLVPGATYHVTHPFGNFDIVADADGNTAPVEIRDGGDQNGSPDAFSGLLAASATHITKFLRQIDPAPLLGYIGDGISPSAIEPGPNGNTLQIAGSGIDPSNADGDGNPDLLTVKTWIVAGKLFAPTIRETAPVPFDVREKTVPYSFSADDFGPISVTGPDCALDPSSPFFSNSENAITIDIALEGPHACSVSISNGDGQMSNVLVVAFNVPPKPVPSTISISPASLVIDEGGTQQFTAMVRDQFGNPIAAPVTWTSSDPAVAFVDASGAMSAGKPGSATITASVLLSSGPGSAISAAVPVTVTAAVAPAAPAPPLCKTSADANKDGKIDDAEVLANVREWKNGMVENLEVFEAIGFWKEGTGC